MTNAAPPPPRRMRPLEAWRGVRKLLADPDDTAAVFQVIRGMGGRSLERLLGRVKADPVGRRVLAERRALLPVLADRAALRALPEGSLGRAYARFMDAEQISAEGLVQASESAPDPPRRDLGPEAEVLGRRLLHMHDLWHVVTGYGRDLVGEAALLAFSYAQTRNRGVGLLAAVGAYNLRKAGTPHVVATVHDGYRRGRAAALLPAADWEALLARPLEEVRERLGVEPVGDYPQLRSAGAPPLPA